MAKIPPRVIAIAVTAAAAVATPFIGGWEGLSRDPYKDMLANGIFTVCFGETRVPMRRYSDAECVQMLNKAVEEFAGKVLQCTPILAYHPYQLAAATSLAYNIGIGAYCRSTAAKFFNTGDLRSGCNQFVRWRMAGGVVVQGLVNRRKAETELCLTGL